MTRCVTRWWPLPVLVCVLAPATADAQLAQLALKPTLLASAQSATTTQGELHGVVQDEHGLPLSGAVVSALGSTTAFAVSDREGRFLFRSLPYGPYLLRAHLQGYTPARSRVVQVNSSRGSWTIALTRSDGTGVPSILAAGVGTTGEAPAAAPSPDDHDHGEVAWRLRHLKRSVLKDSEMTLVEDPPSFDDGAAGFARAVGQPARLASSLLSELPLTGQFNLLTTASFNRPQDLFAVDSLGQQSVAYLSLVAPTSTGEWTMRGTLTQGDISSWIVAGSFARRADAVHRYEAGLSYSTQRYQGGNIDALSAMRDGARNVGTLYAYDDWAIAPRMRVAYGAKYANYDYLAGDRTLLSPRASVTVRPVAGDSFSLRTSVSHREMAPGAEEFVPPTVGLWIPPERTFSALGRQGFVPERVDHFEIAAEREWQGNLLIGVRAFRQRVGDQMVTLFGIATDAPRPVGHYVVGSAGNLEAQGWGVSVSRNVSERLRAAVDYSRSDARRTGPSPQARRLTAVAAAVLRDLDTVHDVTASAQTVVPVTATRVLVLYKMSNAFADSLTSPGMGARFDVQVNQALPFMKLMKAHWEVLVAVRNTFRDDQFDGSVYDEVLVVRPPKRVLGGVTVRF